MENAVYETLRNPYDMSRVVQNTAVNIRHTVVWVCQTWLLRLVVSVFFMMAMYSSI
jgi:hypothetical protein